MRSHRRLLRGGRFAPSLRLVRAEDDTVATGKKAASAAGKTLRKKGEPKLEKRAEASALAQAKKKPKPRKK